LSEGARHRSLLADIRAKYRAIGRTAGVYRRFVQALPTDVHQMKLAVLKHVSSDERAQNSAAQNAAQNEEWAGCETVGAARGDRPKPNGVL
jgi:hypothetical protein